MERFHLLFLRKVLAEGGFLEFLFLLLPGLAMTEIKGRLQSGPVLSVPLVVCSLTFPSLSSPSSGTWLTS